MSMKHAVVMILNSTLFFIYAKKTSTHLSFSFSPLFFWASLVLRTSDDIMMILLCYNSDMDTTNQYILVYANTIFMVHNGVTWRDKDENHQFGAFVHLFYCIFLLAFVDHHYSSSNTWFFSTKDRQSLFGRSAFVLESSQTLSPVAYHLFYCLLNKAGQSQTLIAGVQSFLFRSSSSSSSTSWSMFLPPSRQIYWYSYNNIVMSHAAARRIIWLAHMCVHDEIVYLTKWNI